MYAQLRNQLGQVKLVKIGFSWTMLFFQFLTPLFRGDWLQAFACVLLAYLTRGFSMVIYPFFYNRIYIMNLLALGWYPLGTADGELLKARGFRIRHRDFYQQQQPAAAPRGTTSSEDETEVVAQWGKDRVETPEEWEAEKQQAEDAEWRESP